MTTTWAGVMFVGTLVLALAVVYRPFGDYMARVLTTTRAPSGGTGDLPSRRNRSRCRADVGRVFAIGACLQRGVDHSSSTRSCAFSTTSVTPTPSLR